MKLALLLPLAIAAVTPCAYAGNFADAAIAQAGGTPPSEMNLLGSPQGYGDPYGAAPGKQRAAADALSPTDRLLAQQNGYVGNPAGGAQLRRGARGGAADDANAKALMMPQGAAAALYPTPAGLKPPARGQVREIYKSPY
jgi:hypothetical protein